MEFDLSLFKRIGKFKIAIGVKDGWRVFYIIGNDVWEEVGVSVRGVILKVEVFSKKTIILI